MFYYILLQAGGESFAGIIKIRFRPRPEILHNDLVMVYDGILVNGTLEENLAAADWYRQCGFSKHFPKEEYLMMINAYIEDDWDHLESLKKYVEDMDC